MAIWSEINDLCRPHVSTHVQRQFSVLLVNVKSSMARSLPVENLLPQNVGSTVNYLQYSTEAAQWGIILVAVDHNQLWTMASETVDPIDCRSHPYRQGQSSLSASCIVKISAASAGNRPPNLQHTRLPMRPLVV